ncbi:MAG TPA: methylated-DNA--[protein]-cysteine S-methyltransferase [Burkholderiaceae bacterium]|nr:methylated-DNA--[protein]-cysteine S-methyltransferase [Burkholderiaceae bacterium]
MTYHAIMASPLGDILLCADHQGLSGLYFVGQGDCPQVSGLPEQPMPRADRPSDGMMAGQAIRDFRAHRISTGDMFSRPGCATRALAARSGSADDAPPRILKEGASSDVQSLFLMAQRELAEYFAGRRTSFDVPLMLQGTEFQKKIWRALLAIPYGTLSSYGEVARSAGFSARHGRPAGAAVGRNPVTIIIPCHRVVSGTQALTGYTGGLERKFALLELEGFSLF